MLKGLVLKPSFSFHKVEKNGGTLVEASDGLYYICYSTVTSKVLLNRPQNKPGQQFDASYLDKYYYFGKWCIKVNASFKNCIAYV